MRMYSALSFLNCRLFCTWPGHSPGLSHFNGPPGFADTACLHLAIETTLPLYFAARSFMRFSSPPQAQMSRPSGAPCRSGNSMVAMMPPVVFVIGASSVVGFPVKGPPMMISPIGPSIRPPDASIRSATLVPIGTSLKILPSWASLTLPITVRSLLMHGLLSSMASVIRMRVSVLITTALATEGNSATPSSRPPRHSRTTALSSPIG